ncbi:hypothetical protein D9M71_358840 [compost metagenome]
MISLDDVGQGAVADADLFGYLVAIQAHIAKGADPLYQLELVDTFLIALDLSLSFALVSVARLALRSPVYEVALAGQAEQGLPGIAGGLVDLLGGHGLGQSPDFRDLRELAGQPRIFTLLRRRPNHLDVAVRPGRYVLEAVENDDASSRGKEGRLCGLQVD